MRKAMLFVGLVVCVCVLTPTSASALSDWDPDDVAGPFDLRWVGADFTSSTSLTIVVSFYDGFRVEALPWKPWLERQVHVELGRVTEGYFARRAGGRIAFIWGNFRTNCGGTYPASCNRGIVTRPSPDVLRVTIDTRESAQWKYIVGVSTTSGPARGGDRSKYLRLGQAP